MKLCAIVSLILLLCGIISGGAIHGEFPDIIIGDPNLVENDIIGPAISEEELQESLSLKIILEDTDSEEVDPISTSGFFQGDIVVQSEDQLLEILEGDPNGQLSAIKNPLMTWTNGIIPYVLSKSFNSKERGVIAKAMTEYHQRTCIRFVPKKTTHDDYLHILKGRGCSSTIGRKGGVQVVSLGEGCIQLGVVMHELMHATGFWHEQSRHDRDSYVTIIWDNIISGLKFNFDKKSNAVTTDLGLPYDYSSIMHYGSYAFSKSGAATMVAKRRGVTLGQRNGFSDLDVKGLNLLYKCGGVNPKPTPTGCTDGHRFCSDWASKGYCKSNAAYMLIKCKKSCNVCGETVSCKDNNEYCESWAAKGECQRNPAYMRTSCKKSCRACATRNEGCRDEGQFCQDWASKGECSRNPAYMTKSCAKSCGIC